MTANQCQRLVEPPSAPHAVRASVKRKTCIEDLAEGWIPPTDLCSCCTRAFMTALDWVTEPVTLQWHPNFVKRAGSREEVST